MRETERQINIYKEKLPRMKERVGAALVMLLLAVVMTVSSSMAWLVLSSDPEVKGMNTTITANGNLEIALASGKVIDGITHPEETTIGDSALPLIERNITWGNLVNLGDPAYGLENIVLRPAALNKNKLIESPLYAAGYGSDGRVDGLESDFAYAYWNQDIFSADKNEVKYGVRAISSVTYGQAPGQNLALADAVKKAEESINKVQENYQNLATNDALQDLVGLMAAYVQAQIDEKLGSGGEPFVNISPEQIESIYYLMGELKNIIESSADALADIYNLEMLRRTDAPYVAGNKFTGEYLLTAAQEEIQNKLSEKNAANETVVQPSMLEELWQLKTDYTTLIDDLAVIVTYRGRDDVKYRNLNGSTYPTIETYVNHIADVATCTINGTAIGKLSASNISSLTGGGTKPIVIHKGIIQRMDKFTGSKIQTNELSVTIKVFGMGSTAKGKATTSATAPFVLPSEYNNALSGDTSYKGTNPIAGDTFGLALDFFLRTNAPNAHLILQGSPVYETETIMVKATDEDGTEYDVYAFDVEGVTVTAILKDGVYYSYDVENKTIDGELAQESEVTGATKYTQEIQKIVGYSGVNRVWDADASAYLDETSTTQGAGSCYTFYAASPEDQEKSLQLLKHFRIAFIGGEGSLLATASLDTENKFAQSGKVTVPLVLDITNESVTVNGETVYKITELQRNEATFITALVYLEGGQLTNDQVLAAGEIQGQLNIQFGTTTDLSAMNDPVLQEQKCTVSATMEGATEIAFDTATTADLTKTINVSVSGYTPSKVEAYFLREINETQGVRQGKITFEPNGEGGFKGSHIFTAPGKYILREVILDGVTYELNHEPIVFTVEGFTISSVSCVDSGKSFMLTDKSFDTSVSLMFASNDVTKMPTTVKGAFIHTETKNRTTVYFTRSQGSTWEGSATFTTSGEYVMDYVELNDEYYGLAENQHVNIKLDLGLSVSVYTSETNFALESNETRNQGMSLIIRNDSGDPIKDLTNVWLQYAVGTSSTDENTLGADMIWNDDRGMYEGTFHIAKAGIYNFRYVSVKLGNETSTLGVATVAPTLTVVSTTVPDFVSKDGFGETFALNNDGAFSITMKDADAATLDAELENENGEIYYVRGIIEDKGDKQTFTFILPIIDGKQSGTWTLNAVYMTNVYGGANNTFFNGSTENGPDVATENKPMYTVSTNYYFRWWKWSLDMLGVTDGEAPTVTVVSNVNVSFKASSAANKYYGKENGVSNGAVTGLFGATYNLPDLEIEITAGSGMPLSYYGLSIPTDATEAAMNLKYIYSNEVSSTGYNKYGSYTVPSAWSDMIAREEYIYRNISATADEKIYSITPVLDNKTLSIAGKYVATGNLTFNIKTSSGTLLPISVDIATLNEPTFEIWSKAMTVEISAYAPNGEHNTVTSSQKNKTVTSGKEGNRVTVYCKASVDGDKNLDIQQVPYVTLKLTDIGNASKVEMVFDGAYLSTSTSVNGNANSRYSWSNTALECMRYVGEYSGDDGCFDDAVFDGTGEHYSSSISITLGEHIYTMSVPQITINNPDVN